MDIKTIGNGFLIFLLLAIYGGVSEFTRLQTVDKPILYAVIVTFFGFVVAGCIIMVQSLAEQNKDKDEKQILRLAEKDQMSFMFPMITGSGVLGIIADHNTDSKTASCFLLILLLVSLFLGIYYRLMCEKIYRHEAEKNKQNSNTIPITEESGSPTQNGDKVIRKKIFTTTIEKIKPEEPEQNNNISKTIYTTTMEEKEID